jgi:hypothetical protein
MDGYIADGERLKGGRMRYVVFTLLLASPAFAGEPVYSWRARADDPERVYLYLDGKQIGGWCYLSKHYRSFDGENWGAPTGTAPMLPPERRVLAAAQPKPLVLTQQGSTPLQVRGPVRVRLGTAMGQVITDVTMKLLEEIPGAIADYLAKGQYQLDVQFSVSPSPQQPAVGQPAPPNPGQPARDPQRR